jgi:hypothetical protein
MELKKANQGRRNSGVLAGFGVLITENPEQKRGIETAGL